MGRDFAVTNMVGWAKGIVSWEVGRVLNLSVPFTWLMEEARELASAHKGRVVAGGPAVDLMGADWAETPGDCPFDTLSMHNPLATFTTRGCPNRCQFCAVPKIEGEFRELAAWKPAPIVCDNNLLASSMAHFQRVVESLRPFPWIDFNQGLDARLFTPEHAGELAKLKGVKVRFAFDNVNLEGTVSDAIATARAAGLKDISVYVLIGFRDTPKDAQHRLETVRKWGVLPNPMRYQPLDVKRKNGYVAPGWTDRALKNMMRYYSRLNRLGHISFEEYGPNQQEVLW